MPTIPDDMRVYVVGDIHGCLAPLRRLLDEIESHAASRPAKAIERLIFLGDYIDRGPESANVLETLLTSISARFEPTFLRGNHEQMLLDAMHDADKLALWLWNGGDATLASYGVESLDAALARGNVDLGPLLGDMIPHAHLNFMSKLELITECGDYVFVHAGLRPGVAIADQDPHDLLWIREPFLDFEGLFPGFVVHGHTPDLLPVIRPNRLCLDTGSFFTGRISALAIEGDGYEILSS